ncbi:transmembrane amino acid transporter protein [Glomus cerebriforme]|uniref:Transmembrane amino acid transporter protein n=1 Tax=Glomus cerebriforme TaxID=658196 RepID=A0A397TN40_9GLOM|nr:transmembrane amino acid transporter protein [Glomus cerebriforme]
MSDNNSSPDASPINIPSIRQRRAGTGNNLTNIATSLADTLQSWTGNYSLTASTYMSNNIAVPASFIGDNLEQPGTFGQSYSRPGRFNQHLGSLSTNQSYHTAYLSPLPSNYGSIARNSHYPSLNPISGSLTEEGDLLGASFTNNRHSAMWRSSAIEDYKKQPTKFSDHTPLVQNNSNNTYVSLSKIAEIEIPEREGSNFRQSIFNSCNVLIGIGILALPLGFKYAGWFIGFAIFAYCLFVTNYTAKVIKKCLDYDEGLYTYADMGAAAFGEKSRIYIAAFFCLELIASGVALVILVGDSLHAIFPDMSIITLKVIAWIVMTPLTLIAIRYLSYFSLLGILSAICLVNVMVIDGFAKREHPGSLVDPMKTDLFPFQWYNVPMSFGLIMAGFTGHAVFPSVYRDMRNPKQYRKMVNYTYMFTSAIYFLMAACGYLMFGHTVLQEITQNIMEIGDYNHILNQVMIWLVAVYPIPKYALMLNPINLTCEIYYHSIPRVEDWCNNGRGRRTLLKVFSRVLMSTIVLLIAIQVPAFDRVMGILGSFFSYFISAIFPCFINLKLFSRRMSTKEKVLNICIIISSGILSILGTIWAFLPHTNHEGV